MSERIIIKKEKYSLDRIPFIDDSSEGQEQNKLIYNETDVHKRILEKSKNLSFHSKKLTRAQSLNSNKRAKFKSKFENKKLTINVGGVRFETYRETIKLIPESRLANLSKTNSDYDPVTGEFFFDRDPYSFQSILNYYRSGQLHAPLNVCGNQFYEELCFWGINETSIQPCCWTSYSIKRDCDEVLKQVLDEADEDYDYYSEANEDTVPTFSNITNKDSVIKFPRENKKNWLITALKAYYFRVRPSVWRFLDDRNSSKGAKLFFWISVVFLVTSLINFVLETSAIGRIPYEISSNKSLSRRDRDAQTVPDPRLLQLELICNIFFTIEFILRLLSAPNKYKFITNTYTWLEFLAISPVFWPVETMSTKNSWGVKVHNYIEVFYILRILRIFTLVPKYSGLRVLLLTFKNSIGELVLYVVMLVMALMIFGSFVFYAEQIFEEEDNKFDSILISLWWAIVTMTTLGYGDIVPVTPFGYIIGGMCALSGLIFLALPIPVIVNNFTSFYAHAKAREKLKQYSEKAKNLPNRAIAAHFHSNDVKNNTSNSFSSLVKEARKFSIVNSNNDNLLVHTGVHFDKDEQINKNNNNNYEDANTEKFLKKYKINDERNHETRADDRKSLNFDAECLARWKVSKRRTIRRNALIDINHFDTISLS
ncbi:unnamed protein product, partial [Brachionus calyciflorus]